jgi:peptide/nickel transport system substrate-binding protein
LAAAAALAIVLMIATGCAPAATNSPGPGNTSSADVPAASPRAGGHIVEGAFGDIRTINPILAGDTNSRMMANLIFAPLLMSNAKGDLIPGLASEVPTPSADGRTYTFKLRPGVTWSDGTALTAEDVVFTYELMWAPEYKEVTSPHRGTLESTLESVDAPDPATVVMTTKTVYGPFLVQFAQIGILPRHVLGSLSAAEINTTEFNNAPSVASGPFEFVSWDKGLQTELKRNESYYGDKALVDRYILKVVPDQVTLANQLKTGEIDFGPLGPTAVADVQQRAGDRVDVLEFDSAVTEYFDFQLDPAKPGSRFFSDRRVRQALLYALDREQIVESLYFGHAKVATGPIPPINDWAYNADAQPQYPYDKAKAEQLLDEAGWIRGADGVRTKDGVRFEIEVLTNSGNKVREGILQVMEQQWGEIGVVAHPKLIEGPRLVEQLTNLRTFDVLFTGFPWQQDPDQSIRWHSRNAAIGGFNSNPFINDEVDRLLDEAVATTDRETRKQLYYEFQDLMNEELPTATLTSLTGIWGVSKRLEGAIRSDEIGLGPFTQFTTRPWITGVSVVDGQ